MRKLLSIFALIVLSSTVVADEPLPRATGYVNDRADLLSSAEVQQLDSKIKAYHDKSGNEIAVLLVKTIGDHSLEDYAHDVFQSWGVGSKDKDNGVLFLVSLKERKARIEVGYGLEAALTDLESGRLVDRQSPMAQAFRQGDYYGGVNDVINGIELAIGGEYYPPEVKEQHRANGSINTAKLIFFIIFILLSILFRRRRGSRFFIGPFGGLGGGGGFSVGGGSGFGGFGGGVSGGGGASGGW